MICKRVHYQGIVQGVGFRVTTKRLAEKFAVTGYVRNLPDGRVEVIVTGEADEIDRFLGALATRMAEYIQARETHDEPLQKFDTFEIRN